MQFQRFEPSKTLPAAVLDFVLRDSYSGIASPEFVKAIEQGDGKNISEGIDSIILNAETKTRIKLSKHDKLMIYLLAQDEIVQILLDQAEQENYK